MYEVVPEGGGKSHVLHRNLLLPCDNLPLDKPETDSNRKGRETRHNQEQENITQADKWRVQTVKAVRASSWYADSLATNN